MKKKNLSKVFGLMILVIICALGMNKAYAKNNGNGVLASQAQGIDVVTEGTIMDSKYSFSLKNTEDTYVEYWGDVGKIIYFRDDIQYQSFILPRDHSLSGNIGCWMYNAGTYNGKDIDVKCTFYWNEVFVDGNEIYPVISIKQRGKNIGCGFSTQAYEVKYELFTKNSNGEEEELNANMSISIGDIDFEQYFGLKTDAHINSIMALNDTIVSYEYHDGYHYSYEDSNVGSEDGLESVIRYELDNVHSFNVIFGADADPLSYYIKPSNTTEEKLLTRSNDWAELFDSDEYPSGYTFPDFPIPGIVGWGYFDAKGFGPYSVPTPIKMPNKYEISGDEEFTFTTTHKVPDTEPYDSYVFKDILTDCLSIDDVSKVRIVNNKGINVNSLFNIDVSGQVVTATLKDPKNLDFYNNEYRFILTVHRNKNYEDMSRKVMYNGNEITYLQDDGTYLVPNIAHILVNGDIYSSNETQVSMQDKYKVVTKYLDLDTKKEISTKETELYYEEDNYTTVKKNIEGYRYIRDTQNTSGVVGKQDIEVIYYYKKESAGVDVKYIDYITKEEIVTGETLEGLVGQHYETEEKKIEKYLLVETPENASGTMEEEKITVTYEYIKQLNVVVKYVDVNTNQEIASEETNTYNQGTNYTTEQKEIEEYVFDKDSGNTSGTVGDKDIEVIYYYKKPSAGVEVKYIDQVTEKEIEDKEELEGYEGENYTTEAKKIDGYVLVKTPSNASGKMKVEKITVIYEYKKQANLITKHIDANTGKEIAEETKKLYMEGENYEAFSQNIKGYSLVKEPEKKKGIMGREDVIKVFEYKKISAGLIVKYVDEQTNEVMEEKTYTGNVKDIVELEELEFENYELTSRPEEEKVELNEEPQEKIFYYNKKVKIDIEGIDQDTKEVLYTEDKSGLEGEEYKTEPKELEKYDLVKIPDNKDGILKEKNDKVVYEYRRKSGLLVKYVDQDTKKVLDSYKITGYYGDEYATEKKEFEDYRYVSCEGEIKGKLAKDEKEVIYYYKKLVGKVVVTYKDTEGKVLLEEQEEGKVKEKFDIEEKKIDGYRVIKRPTSTEGTYKEGTIELEYILEKIKGTVTVNFIDEQGNEIYPSVSEKDYVGEEFYLEVPEKEGYYFESEKEIKVKYVDGEIVIDVIYYKNYNPETSDINVVLNLMIVFASVVCIKYQLKKIN